MIIPMRLQAKPFAKIKDGIKILELRIYDAKRRNIKLDDEIVFTSVDNANETIHVKVIDLLIYPRFADLIQSIPMDWLGLGDNDRSAAIEAMKHYYSSDEETANGVVGIRFEVIG